MPATICPFLSMGRGDRDTSFRVDPRFIPCLAEHCQLWVETVTGGRCALVVIAMDLADHAKR